MEEGTDTLDQDLVEIHRLAEHDTEFCQRFKKHKEFNGFFGTGNDEEADKGLIPATKRT